ncbi:MAG: cell division ATP-binding protein FtsE [Planktomarina sp.]
MIDFQNVSYSYGGATLLDNVSLSLPQGSFHFLTGPSGAGKTTLIKMCYAELQATEGIVKVFGKDARGLDRDGVSFMRRNIGVVHQDCQFVDHLSVAENVALPLTVAGMGNPKSHGNLDELMAWVGLKHVEDALPPSLSGGERQRAALARALIASPDMILADEPTGNVDWEMSKRLLRLLIELNNMGKTVLMATHDMALIRAAKTQVQSRVLRIQQKQVWLAGADL